MNHPPLNDLSEKSGGFSSPGYGEVKNSDYSPVVVVVVVVA
jgi:hypothetical protein